ncbi:DUF4397 domain-containing protein [Chitinophaga qingshengii]|uniref:DUF4397 domain-containing protein n=1 Tax=Chitinophaga qingshengii TaxID=1569794 RepID=A0ABR7TRD8_9BACT|nr:DUF4397 domain-containing protein [Chitinophaga qingshengii]MBC9932127.1 DUF4397 domain-containing protein [Chitinophaga qingshengii]
MMKRCLHTVMLSLLSAGMLTSCTKKENFTYDNRINLQADAASSVRIVNLRGATELMVNGKQLSSFMLPNMEGYYDQTTTKGTPFFPETGRMGLTYTIPQQFVSADGTVKDIRFASFVRNFSLALTRGFVAKDDFNHPTDYYFTYFAPNTGQLTDSLFPIPRSVSPPANPQRCKVRLLNLSTANSLAGGNMRVVWADGTTVAGLDNIGIGQYSDYIELPYGTYQLKVMTMDGVPVPGVGGSGQDFNVVNPQTGTIMLPGVYAKPPVNGFVDSKLTFAPLKTYQPGGVYTIVVAEHNNFRNPTGGSNGETYPAKNNGFRIIADVEPQNNTYARLQAVNVLPGKSIKVTMDGNPLGNTLSFSAASAFNAFLTGTHTLKVTDAAGVVLTDSTFTLLPGDNQTAWIYETAAGKPAISLVANNLSNQYYNGATEDGSYSTIKIEFPSWIRFMNFCPDLPEATFTTDDGQVLANGVASERLQLGIPLVKNPYAKMEANFYQRILAYASQQNVVPGNWLREVSPLRSRDFIARPELYAAGQSPLSETGVYTVALIGNLNTSKPGSEKARMIIIKHNQ